MREGDKVYVTVKCPSGAICAGTVEDWIMTNQERRCVRLGKQCWILDLKFIHPTIQAAQAHAEELRREAVAKLERQLAALPGKIKKLKKKPIQVKE